MLLVRAIYELFVILKMSKLIGSKRENKREFRTYDTSIHYTNKKFTQKFVDYQGRVM